MSDKYYDYNEEADSRRFVIKLTGFDPPKYIFNSRTYVSCLASAKTFSRAEAGVYVRKHRDILSGGYKIVQVEYNSEE